MNGMGIALQKYGRQLIICSFLLLSSFWCRAQMELSAGIDMSYPVLLNSNNTRLNYGQIGFGMHGAIAYKPENTQFFPMLNIAFGRTKLPLKQFSDDVATINFNYWNVMLNENYIIHFTQSVVYIYGGIGFSYLSQKGLGLSGKNSEQMQIHLDSTANVNHAFPAINLGFEYVYGEGIGSKMYLSLGLNFQYIYLLPERNQYYSTVYGSNYYQQDVSASLTGNVIIPSFFIAFHFMPGKPRNY